MCLTTNYVSINNYEKNHTIRNRRKAIEQFIDTVRELLNSVHSVQVDCSMTSQHQVYLFIREFQKFQPN